MYFLRAAGLEEEVATRDEGFVARTQHASKPQGRVAHLFVGYTLLVGDTSQNDGHSFGALAPHRVHEPNVKRGDVARKHRLGGIGKCDVEPPAVGLQREQLPVTAGTSVVAVPGSYTPIPNAL